MHWNMHYNNLFNAFIKHRRILGTNLVSFICWFAQNCMVHVNRMDYIGMFHWLWRYIVLSENTFIILSNLGPVNTFLTWGFFAPLSRLSYNIYLMHFLVIWTRYAYFRQRLPFSHYTMVSLT